MAPSIDLKNPDRPIRVGVILVNSTTEILDIAPIDIFMSLSKHMAEMMPPGILSEEQKKQTVDIEFHWVTEHGDPGKLTSGAVVQATHSFETCPTLDIFLMGAHFGGYTMTPGEIAFIQKCHKESQGSLFICGGCITALQAGLLDGKTATGPRIMIEGLKQTAPNVNWVAKRWANDGKLWTSSTLLNGTDMMRAFFLSVWGGEGTLADWTVKFGGWPDRDVNFKDVAHDL